MPASIAVAVASTFAAEAIGAAIITDAFIASASWITYAGTVAAIQAGVSFALTSVVRDALAPDGPSASPSFTAAAAERSHVLRSPIALRQTIYGRTITSGPLVFAASSADHNTLHLVIALAGHECEAIDEVYFGDDLVDLSEPANNTVLTTETVDVPLGEGRKLALSHGETLQTLSEVRTSTGTVMTDVTPDLPVAATEYAVTQVGGGWAGRSNTQTALLIADSYAASTLSVDYSYTVPNPAASRYLGWALIQKHLGAADQEADAELVSAGLGWTTEHRLRGVCYLYVRLTYNREIYPRGIPNIKAVVRGKKLLDPRSGLMAYSTNPTLMIRDYLTGSHGLQAGVGEIDAASFVASANLSDEAVALAGGGSESRYAASGVCSSGLAPRAALEQMLSAGVFSLVWTAGTYKLLGGAYSAPTLTLTADHLRGALGVRASVPRQELYNAIRGTYMDPQKNWTVGDFPPLRNAAYATDDGATIWRDIELPYTTSPATAQRIAKIILEKGRQGIVVNMPCNLSAFRVAVGDTVRLTIAHLGWSAKEFLCVGWRFAETGGIDLTLHEESASAYVWSTEESVNDPAPNSNLPDPLALSAPGTPAVVESLYETSGSAGVKSRATLSWSAVADAFVIDYLPEYRVASGAWTQLPAVSGLSVDINDIAPAAYEFRVRARNVLGVMLDYSDSSFRQVLGLTAPPAAPAGFSVIKSAGFALASWSLHPDLDVRIGGRMVVRHSPLTSGATWNDGVIFEEFTGDSVTGSVPLVTGTYMLKALDSSGNYSASAASFVATEGLVTGLVTVGTSIQHSAFAGAKTNVAVLDGALRLDSASTIASMSDPVSTWPNISALGGISATGSYDFAAVLDLGTVATRRFEADISATSFDTGDLISFRDLVSTWGAVSGAVINDCDVTLYAALTNDNPAATPTWSAWTPFFVADFTCRAAKFRLDVASGSVTHNIAISTLAVDAKEPA